MSFLHVCQHPRVVFGGPEMKADTPHRIVRWLTSVSAQTQLGDHVCRVLPGRFAPVSLPSWCLCVSVAWCLCPPKAQRSGVELFRTLSIFERSCPLKTASQVGRS